MKVRIASLIIGVSLFSFTHAEMQKPHHRVKVLGNIHYLKPYSFSYLPEPVKLFLGKNGYLIPQCADTPKPHNVIKGRFLKPDQIDYAVLASKKGRSAIIIFPNGSIEGSIKLNEAEDAGYLQNCKADLVGYSRIIDPVDKAYILKHYQAYGGPKPPPIDHQGINDIYAFKGSVVLYNYHGKWLKLTGAD